LIVHRNKTSRFCLSVPFTTYQQKVSMSTHGSYSMRSKASFENEAKATGKESGVSTK